jgi:hypothetical protein
MKLSKDELISKINGLEIDDEVKISLLEDVTDSMEVAPEVDNTELEEVKAKYEELKTKYKERFLKGDEVATETEVVEKEEVEEDEEEPRKYEDLFDEKGELK